MKKIIASAALATCGTIAAVAPSHAQTSVTTYGIIDAAVEYYSNANAAGDNVVRMPSLGGGMFPSRLGFRGKEELGSGLSTIFTLETGFSPDAGVVGQGGRLFGRQAFVGLAGSWGQVTLGRNYNMYTTSTFDVDTIGPSQYGLGALDSFIPNGRSDNSIAYKGTFDRFTVGATFSLGRDTSAAGGPAGTNCPGENAADSKQCREVSAMLRYDGANWGVVGAYDKLNGGPTASGGLTSSALSDTRAHLGAYVKLGEWKIGGGFMRRDNDGNAAAPRSDITYLGAAYKLTPALTIDGQVSRLDYKASPNDSTQYLLRGIYGLSKRTSVYVAAGHINNSGTAAVTLTAGGSVGAGMSQNGLITGLKHSF